MTFDLFEALGVERAVDPTVMTQGVDTTPGGRDVDESGIGAGSLPDALMPMAIDLMSDAEVALDDVAFTVEPRAPEGNPVVWGTLCADMVHVSERTRRQLELNILNVQAFRKGDTGFFILVPYDEGVDAEFPADLAALVRKARETGSAFINLQEEGELVPGLEDRSEVFYNELEQADDALKAATESVRVEWELRYARKKPEVAQGLSRQRLWFCPEAFSEGCMDHRFDETMMKLRRKALEKVMRRWSELYQYKGDRDEPVEAALAASMDPSKFWEALDASFGEDVRFNLRLKVVAAQIFDSLSLGRAEFVAKNGKVTISDRIYCEKETFGQHKGEYRVTISYESNVVSLVEALSAFADHLEEGDMADALDDFLRKWQQSGRVVTPRERFDFGPGLSMTTFKEEWKWTFSEALAEKLRAFIAEFKDYEPPDIAQTIAAM